MRLSSIKLAGFKSFVEPTKIPFPDQMTCVVGPNGCGKSNVIDAVRWVLGESSAKNLRGDAMTDVIFNGSTKRKAISQASVELLFDNTEGRLPGTFADRNQIAIKRLVTRDGQSLYFLNGSKCRKRDITDIFLGTGLGPRSYAIIEQGMISRLIESKPQELRIFLEEAAGISKYKERRRETQTRIKNTRENMERLLDVRQELQNQLEKLELQAQQASKYKTLKSQERDLRSWTAVLKWQGFVQKQTDKAEQIAKLEDKLAFFADANSGHDALLAGLEQEIKHLSDGYEHAQQSQHNIETQLAKLEQQKLSLAEKRRQLEQQAQELQLQQEEVATELKQQDDSASTMVKQVEDASEAVAVAELALEELEQCGEQHREQQHQLEQQHQDCQQQVQQLERQHQQLEHQIAQHQHTIAHQQARQTELEEQAQEHQSQALDAELQQAQAQQQQLIQAMASLQSQAQQQQTQQNQQSESLAALEQAHAQAQQALQDKQSTIKALSQWAEQSQQQSGISMLSQLRVAAGFEHAVEAALLGFSHLSLAEEPNHNGVWHCDMEIAPESVASKIHQGVFPSFLSKVKLQTEAQPFVACSEYLFAVTTTGLVIGENFRARIKNDEGGALKRYAELQACQAALPKLAAQVTELQSQITTQQQARAEAAEALADTQQQVHQHAQQIAGLKSKIEMLQVGVETWQTTATKIQASQAQVEQQLKQLQDNISQENANLALLMEQMEQAQAAQTASAEALRDFKQQSQSRHLATQQAQQQLHDKKLALQQVHSEQQLSHSKLLHLQQREQELQSWLQQTQASLNSCEEPLEAAQEQVEVLLMQQLEAQEQKHNYFEQMQQAKQHLSEKQASLKETQSEVQQLTESLQQLKLDEQSLMLKAQNALEPLEVLGRQLKTELENLPDDANLGRYQAQLNQISSDVEKLGAVNLAAIDEFAEAKQRKEYLDAQLQDLSDALASLEGVIRKIDRETKARFSATFEQVNSDLAELFPKVFGGGSAYLELTSDDLLESGVSIMARPPGKKNSTIHLLSGGEKALTALSLVFSIFRLNPAPFCMLDEVDAPLDDANVGRFCRLVEEMSQTVQFIYISHNKVAMEMAGRLTGVTMAEPGVSRMVAVDIEQAVQMAQA
ncbi:chromosome segregation SMC family protein [Pseudoalteromonas 'SMAR']|uniref:chromosome segregation SMC family protein n=1 Tax=Pseudoalteromonas 'SMAR' TaxID=3416908 RepID=UPI003AF29E5B